MTSYIPQPGDRARVVLEGEVLKQRAAGWGDFRLNVNDCAYSFFMDDVVSVERLPDPEPEWRPGDVVRDAYGRTYGRTTSDSYPWIWLDATLHGEVRYPDDPLSVRRPLTLLVRDGKPVTR